MAKTCRKRPPKISGEKANRNTNLLGIPQHFLEEPSDRWGIPCITPFVQCLNEISRPQQVINLLSYFQRGCEEN